MIKSKKQMFIVIGAFALVMMLGTVTYAFFNYTRTGALNNLGTGQIYFNTTEGPTLNLTNLFPMTSTEAGEANLDSVSVVIEGNTTYSDGEEYEITLVDVTNTVNGKKIPLNYTATYAPNTDKVIGTPSNDYWNAREDKDANIYLLNATGEVEEDKQVLVGYVDNGATGINGTLTIKAYIDADRIAISDTFYGNATATPTPTTPTDEYGTTTEWVDGRVVLTTEEWNSLNSTPISFKIKAESNEGIWVKDLDAPLTMDEMCPDCVYTYSTYSLVTTWNTINRTPDVLTSSDYKENYEDVIATSGMNYFLGLKLNENNQIEKAYACGLYNDETPFCIEGYNDDSKFEINNNIVQSSSLWNNTCTMDGEWTRCPSPSPGSILATITDYGPVYVGTTSDDYCYVSSSGFADCGNHE